MTQTEMLSGYAEEGGNSFIEGFMEELRALPKQPMSNIEKININ